jgi:hypothetical protein
MTEQIGRVKPWGPRAIHKQKCAICGEPAKAQWSMCALGNRYVPVCAKHDIEINSTLVGKILKDEAQAATVMREYVTREFPEMADAS